MKVALLTCIAFTTGVCWLVSQVSRQPGVPAPSGRTPTTLMSKTTTVPPADQLQRPSAGEPLRDEPSSTPPVAQYVGSVPIPAADKPVALPPIVQPEPLAVNTDTGDSANPDAPPVRETADADTGGQSASPPVAEATPQPVTYRVAKGDSLSRIAARTYGADSPSVRKAIIALNPKIAKRPNVLYAGEELQLPVLSDSTQPPDTAKGAIPSGTPSRGAPPVIAADSPSKSADGARPRRDVEANKVTPKTSARTDTAARNTNPRGTNAKPSPPVANKQSPPKPASKAPRVVQAKDSPSASPVKKPAAKTAAKSTANPPGKAKQSREVATAAKSSKPAPASAKSKGTSTAQAAAKDSKQPAAKPTRGSDSKPVTRRRGGSIDAG